MEESSDKESVDVRKTSDQSFPNLGTSEIQKSVDGRCEESFHYTHYDLSKWLIKPQLCGLTMINSTYPV